ncbi:MAG: hypothetical protein CMP10_15260 [Zetaproteobacteria bacterium]|nr:hypothetical protein [Pseudobdellovibrionaceae bacterium]
MKHYISYVLICFLYFSCTHSMFAMDSITFDIRLIVNDSQRELTDEDWLVIKDGKADDSPTEKILQWKNHKGMTYVTGIIFISEDSNNEPLVMGLDINGNKTIEPWEPKILPHTSQPQVEGELLRGSTSVVYIESSCQCADKSQVCHTSRGYDISILTKTDRRKIWGPEYHKVIMDNHCSFTVALGKTMPLDNISGRWDLSELEIELYSSRYTQIVPLHPFMAGEGQRGPQGPRGFPGPQGQQGSPGPTGPKGEIGIQGPKGDQGIPGPKGIQGDSGISGPKGDKGDKGDSGEKGNTGDQGPRGPIGSAGPKGEQGDPGEKGDQGEAGNQGPKGDTGSIGLTGPAGPAGDKGPKGESGQPGTQGEQGPQGIQGEKGAKGTKGDQGEPGEDGETTDIGPLQTELEDLRQRVSRLEDIIFNIRQVTSPSP